MNKLKLCPFCEGEATRGSWKPSDTWSADVECTKCPARVQVDCCDSDEEAIEKAQAIWNKRVEKDKQLEAKSMHREQDLYLEFGNGDILVLTSEDNKVILSKINGQGEIGEKGPIKQGDEYAPSGNDVVMKFKNIESLLVLKDAIEDIEKNLVLKDAIESIKKNFYL